MIKISSLLVQLFCKIILGYQHSLTHFVLLLMKGYNAALLNGSYGTAQTFYVVKSTLV